jgi:tRNA pseudouridine38/39 synthase
MAKSSNPGDGEDLDKLSRKELVERVLSLRQQLSARPAAPPQPPPQPEPKQQKQLTGRKAKRDREFDFSKYSERHIALKIAYDGRNFHGLAWQKNAENTIEGHLLTALERTCLIRGRVECRISKAGRTDKGVSSSGNVLAVYVRSNRPLDASASDDSFEEIDYVSRLNGVLPEKIRVLGWAAAAEGFDARFSARSRVYRYFFLKGALDLGRMREAGARFVGTHDFRNFCKADTEHVHSFERTMMQCDVDPISWPFAANAPDASGDDRMQVCAFTIKGRSFLWHQVRCMVAVLFLVGDGKESPDAISTLLDVDAEPGKPQYNMASELPLVLHEIGYDTPLAWHGSSPGMQGRLVEDALEQYGLTALHHAYTATLLGQVTSMRPSPQWWPAKGHNPSGTEGFFASGGVYVPLLQRCRNQPLKLRTQDELLAARDVRRGATAMVMDVREEEQDDA